MIDLATLKRLLKYDPATGVFTWLVWRPNGVKAGDVAGFIESNGYRVISLYRKFYKAHRLAWFYMTGEWPKNELDHVNGVRTDNRLANLRAADRSLNKQNMRKARRDNRTGLLGVYEQNGRFRAGIKVRGEKRRRHLGTFATAQDAHVAYLAAKRALHEGCTI